MPAIKSSNNKPKKESYYPNEFAQPWLDAVANPGFAFRVKSGDHAELLRMQRMSRRMTVTCATYPMSRFAQALAGQDLRIICHGIEVGGGLYEIYLMAKPRQLQGLAELVKGVL